VVFCRSRADVLRAPARCSWLWSSTIPCTRTAFKTLLRSIYTVSFQRAFHNDRRHTLLCRCSGLVVEHRTRNRDVAGSTHTRSPAGNLEQVANLLCAQANSASYPQRDGKINMMIIMSSSYTATGWRPIVWLIGAMVCLLAAPWSNCQLARAKDGHIMRCGTIGSC